MADSGSKGQSRVAELQYSKDLRRLELVVPHGTKVPELAKLLTQLGPALGRLPRGCTPCTSGDHMVIREELEHVIRVDLEKGTIV